MATELTIRPVQPVDIPLINDWARREGFAPGTGDIGIYRQTDRQGIWTGCLDDDPIVLKVEGPPVVGGQHSPQADVLAVRGVDAVVVRRRVRR